MVLTAHSAQMTCTTRLTRKAKYVLLHSKVKFLDHVGLWGGRDDHDGFVGNVGQRHVVRAVVHFS